MKESSGYHFGRAAMTALLIWGFFVLAIDGCNGVIRDRAIQECWKDTGSQTTAYRSDVIECLENLGLDESEISEHFAETEFNSKSH